MVDYCDIEMEMARGQVYGFFSALILNPPSADMLSTLLCSAGPDALGPVFPGHPANARIKDLADEYSRGVWKVDDFLLDYEGMFRIPGEGYVHPFESIYTSENFAAGRQKGLAVLAAPAREVAAIYREHALVPREGFTEFPDHLGVELDFMAFLCQKSADALAKRDDEKSKQLISGQISFLSNHLLKWVPRCIDRVRENAQTPFYACLVALLGSFLDEERARAALN